MFLIYQSLLFGWAGASHRVDSLYIVESVLMAILQTAFLAQPLRGGGTAGTNL